MNKRIVIIAAILAICLAAVPSFSVNAAYYCRSDACLKAQEKEQEYQRQANEMSAIAATYEEAVANLNTEIAAIESSIAANAALAADINAQILETQAKLESEQEALAEMLVSIHFENNSEPIRILASSKSISDLAEKQAREEVVKQEIAAASERVKSTKTELENEKAAVDSLIEVQNQQRSEIAAKRSEQADLAARYANDASFYKSYADAARTEKQELMEYIAEETATCQYSGDATTQYYNDYPYQNSCPSWPNFFPYAGMMCQCTSYAGWKAMSTYGISFSSWGNAKDWGWYYDEDNEEWIPRDSKGGYEVNTIVEAGTVAVSSCGQYGHVMWVESVNYDDGTINVSEYNNYGSNIYHRQADFGARTHVSTAGLRFIHFR